MEKVCTKCGNYYAKGDMTYCPSCGGGTVELPEGRTASKININGWIYFGVNTVFLLFALLRKLQGIEFIFFLLGILLLWVLLVREKNRIYSVSEKLTAILFIDALLVFLSGMDIWRMNMTGNVLSDLFRGSGKWILWVVMGFAFYVTGVKKKRIVLQWIAFQCFGMVFPLLWGWTLGSWTDYVQLFYLLYTILNLTWCVAMKAALTVGDRRVTKKRWMSFGLLGVLVFLRFYCPGIMESYLVTFPEKVTTFLAANLGPGKVVLAVAILVGASLFLGLADARRSGCDALVLCGIAGAIMVLKATTVFFIPLVYVTFFIYGFIFLHLLKKEKTGAQCYPLNRAVLILMISVAMAVALYLVSIGLWLVVLAGLIFAKLVIPKPGQKPRKNLIAWILVWITAEALLAVWFLRVHPQVYLTIILIAVTFFVLLRMINWKHPAVELKRNAFKGALCLAFAVLMLLVPVKCGTAIHFTYDPGANQVSVDLKARGKDNSVYSVVYYWSDQVLLGSGRAYSAGSAQPVLQEEIQVNAGSPAGRCLVVRASDQNGVWTEKQTFVPSFYFTMTGQ